jgi:hypothetical protein
MEKLAGFYRVFVGLFTVLLVAAFVITLLVGLSKLGATYSSERAMAQQWFSLAGFSLIGLIALGPSAILFVIMDRLQETD